MGATESVGGEEGRLPGLSDPCPEDFQDAEALKKAFALPLSQDESECVLAIMLESTTPRAAANFWSWFNGQDWGAAYRDVQRVKTHNPSFTRVERVRARLDAAGFRATQVDPPRPVTRSERRERVLSSLWPIFDALDGAFPGVLAEEDYACVLAVLSSDRKSDDVIASVVSMFGDIDYAKIRSKLRFVREFPPAADTVQRVRERLAKAGYRP